MPKLVKEIDSGNVFNRSSEGNALTDSATRVFKIIKNDPDEAIIIPEVIWINIGDVYTEGDPIPCVSF